MLTYRDYVYAKMADYAAAQVALVTIPEQIETERLRRETLRAQKTDGDRIQGGDVETDDAWVTSIATETYLTERLAMCRNIVESVAEMLSHLDDSEREIVMRLIVQRRRNGALELAEDWGVDERTIYRAKDRTLIKIARLMTGEARA